ncbi:MAG: hypothetical protein IJY18_03125 [Clostridia bacterium]|nr:hypothetical protein [Clostridia bacterium]
MSDLMQTSSLRQELGEEMRKIEQKQAVAQYNQKVDALSEKIVYHSKLKTETSQQIVEVLLPFLEVAIEMQGIIEMVTSINDVVQLIGDAISILDTTMQSSRNILGTTNQVKYGFFQRLKQKMEIRRAKLNNQKRVKSITDQIVGYYEMAMSMAEGFKTVPVQMRSALNRIKNRNQKKKRGKGAAEEPTRYELSDNLKKVLTDKGADLESMGYGSGSASSSTGGGASSGSGSGSGDSGAGSLSDGL